MNGRPYELTGAIAPTRLSSRYRLGLFVVAATMVALPLIYLALILLVGQLTVWHLRHDAWLMGLRPNIWGVAAYLGPAIAGVVMMFFMIKPILARRPAHVPPVALRREDEPLLFTFIDDICRLVRAPAPSRVEIDCEVNASAGFDRGAPMLRRSLVLTIGLPLAAGLTVRQLGGVIAHEFGHFAQGSALRLTFVVRSINYWFSRVVFDRDAWDDKLARGAENGFWMVSLTMRLAQAAVWCSRQILRGLMNAGHAISCYMMRQMEYDADSYEVKLVGTQTFLETSARMRELGVQSDIGHGELQDGARRLRLPDDLPAFVIRQRDRLTTDAIARIREIPEEAAGRFDTHPSHGQRAAAAEALAESGVLRGGDDCATVLFRGFDAISRSATRHHYEHALGIDLAAHALIDTERAVQASLGRHETGRALDAFLGEAWSWMRPVRLAWPPREEAATPAALRLALDAARAAVVSERAAVAAACRKLESLEESRILALSAEEILRAGFPKVIAEAFELTGGSLADAHSAAARAVEQQRELLPQIEAFEVSVDRRFGCALSLAVTASADHQSAARRSEVAQLAAAVNGLAAGWPMIVDLNGRSAALEHLLSNAGNAADPAAFSARVDHIVDQLQASVRRLGDAVAGIEATVGGDDASAVPLGDLLEISAVKPGGQAPTALVERAISLRLDLLGRLAAIALDAEAREQTANS